METLRGLFDALRGLLETYWPVPLIVAAFLEVWGDAQVRQGLGPSSPRYHILVGGVVLTFYGIFVNVLRWDFAKLLGVYVVFFAAVAVGWGYYLSRFFPDEKAKVDDPNFYQRAFWGLLFIGIGGVIMSWPQLRKFWGTIVGRPGV
ncbi:MAG TPA: hypothetical protein VF591_24710 [Pyrinomonadaceae bacterium]|jgi:drug/metabolite transporter superfamily protein YnfA